MLKSRILAIVFIVLGVFLGNYVFQSENNGSNPFRLGLDLSGGSYLVYKADISEVDESEIGNSMGSLRDVIERRINLFGVAEPNVQTETNSIGTGLEHRLVVELPGVTDLDQAVEMIGQTPFLEFRVERPREEIDAIIAEQQKLFTAKTAGEETPGDLDYDLIAQDIYTPTELTGKYLEKSQLQFSQGGVHGGGSLQSQPIIGLNFNKEGGDLFEQITEANIGKTVAIYLDGQPISTPRVNAKITGGSAIIEGTFTIDEAKELVGRLNSGALPIPIELISTNTIGPTLGQDAVDAGLQAGIFGLILVSLILIIWYRLPGLLAVLALAVYSSIMLWLFKFIPVTLTSAGIAGFIISIGIAVDANILIFERLKEELRAGKSIYESIRVGFDRAWASIRDANVSSIISAVILFWFGTALIKGFALTFGLGIMISMFTAVTITRSFLYACTTKPKVLSKDEDGNETLDSDFENTKLARFLYSSGLKK